MAKENGEHADNGAQRPLRAAYEEISAIRKRLEPIGKRLNLTANVADPAAKKEAFEALSKEEAEISALTKAAAAAMEQAATSARNAFPKEAISAPVSAVSAKAITDARRLAGNAPEALSRSAEAMNAQKPADAFDATPMRSRASSKPRKCCSPR